MKTALWPFLKNREQSYFRKKNHEKNWKKKRNEKEKSI